MPHNYIFGQELSHHFVENRVEEQCIGHTNINSTVGMKRKESWQDLEAGNFEIHERHGGPTLKKKVKFSPGGQGEDLGMSNGEDLDMSNGHDITGPNIKQDNSSQLCHSMVAHMTMSFRNDNLQDPCTPENINHELINGQRSGDVDMECAMPVENGNVPQSAMQEDICYRSVAEQEPSSRKSHFYVYRCKPQYSVFH